LSDSNHGKAELTDSQSKAVAKFEEMKAEGRPLMTPLGLAAAKELKRRGLTSSLPTPHKT
jgi:hypothetical protein